MDQIQTDLTSNNHKPRKLLSHYIHISALLVEQYQYQMHIAEIIENHCEGCHSGNNPSGGLLLTNYDQVVAASGYSGLADRIQLPLSDPNVMPPNGGLSACDTEALLNWVANGTPFE